MIIVHMKSGKTHPLKLDFPTFKELHDDKTNDSIAAREWNNERLVHILPKESIESVEVHWEGKIEELTSIKE